MTEIALPRAGEREISRRPRTQLYPLQVPLLLAGAVAAIVALVLQGWLIALAVFVLFALVGASWRVDMLPIVPFCLAYQWLAACAGLLYWRNFGHYPGGGNIGNLTAAVLLAMIGLASVLAGLRFVMAVFARPVFAHTLAPPQPYDIRKLFILTIVAFAFGYAFDAVPKQVWFGGAQIIENLMTLRFVPYFILLIAVFEQRRGYGYAVGATAWVIGPQLLTGFSRFKEVLFVLLIAALTQWRPWIRTRSQARQNLRIVALGLVGFAFMAAFGVIWSGGVKQQWRNEIWRHGVTSSPIERMGLFFTTVAEVTPKLDLSRSVESLVARLSSGTLYLSYVIERVPRTLPHENGALFGRAIANATQPRFLFAEKKTLGGDSWLVRKYAGIAAAGDEAGASIGLGYFAEFYVDFGPLGVVVLGFFWGAVCGGAMVLLAMVSPSREIFFALAVALLIGYFMSFDGSFIKLFAGLLQRTLILAAVMAVIGRPVQVWLLRAGRPASG